MSPRQNMLIRFALWRFAADARAQAGYYSQQKGGSEATRAKVGAFLRDADDAEHLLGLLRDGYEIELREAATPSPGTVHANDEPE